MQGWVDIKIHQYAPVHFGFRTYTENADVCSGNAKPSVTIVFTLLEIHRNILLIKRSDTRAKSVDRSDPHLNYLLRIVATKNSKLSQKKYWPKWSDCFDL